MMYCPNKILLVLTLCFLGIQTTLAQPIGPSNDITSQNKSLTPQDKTTTPPLDLPYKPIDLEITSESDFKDGNEVSDLDTLNSVPTIDWEALPFIPSKSMSFLPAPDPSLDEEITQSR